MKKHRQPKWLLCLLISALMLSLTACGASSSDSGETNAESTTTDISDSEAVSETAAESDVSESSGSESIEGTAENSSSASLPIVSEDTENQATYAGEEDEIASQFQWYKWEFSIDANIDAVGTSGDGIGTLYFRLYVPE
ncbi:MAG: hypothetical protein LUE23_02115, partial [Lachnospiraceae bacterium]|nr:hypothetical protein [Lachnospiraceae bacterium]